MTEEESKSVRYLDSQDDVRQKYRRKVSTEREGFNRGAWNSTRENRTFRQILVALNSSQKPGKGVPAYTRWVNRRFARWMAATCAALGMSANQVSAVSAIVSLTGIILLLTMQVTPMTGVLVAWILAFGYVLDSADGQVARVTGTGSRAGEWLDHVIDSARTPLIHLAVLVQFFAIHALEPWAVWIPVVYCLISTSHFMSQILAEQLLRTTPQTNAVESKTTISSGTRDKLRSILMLHTDPGSMCWIFIFWGFPPFFLLVYGLMMLANTLTAVVSMARKYRTLQMVEGKRK